MNEVKRSLQFYLWAVMGTGALVLLIALVLTPQALSAHDLTLGALLSCLATLTYLAPVKLATKRQITLYTSLQIVAVLTLTPGMAAAVIAAGVALGNVYHRRPWFNTLFNTGQIAITVTVAGAAYRLIAPVSLVRPGHSLLSYIAVVPAAVLLYLVSALAVDCAAAIQRGCSPFADWWALRGPTLAPQALLALIGVATATAADRLPWLLLVAVTPVLAVRSMMHAAMEFDTETVRLADQAADAEDARNPLVSGRSYRVAEAARRLARACQLSDVETQRVYLAARLHDVAALLRLESDTATDAHITPGFPAGERAHADQGARYISRDLKLPGVAEVIRYHHERFDGRGYPRGIAGPDIPQEARILALADAWVTLTSPALHRPALTETQALTVLRADAGTKWDPTFVALLSEHVEGATQGASEAVSVARMPTVARAVA